jgi:hypothetical protein
MALTPKARRLGLLTVIFFITSCTGGPQYTIQKLPSGREIKVVGITKISFTKGDPALMLSYQTDLPINDLLALRKEAEEIWPVFRINVEQAQLKGAIISARQAPSGIFIKTSRLYNFTIVKHEDDSWHFQ